MFYKLNILIDRSGLRKSKYFWFINPPILLVLCSISLVVSYLFFNSIFRMISISVIMAIPGFVIPIICLVFISQEREAKIEKMLGNFFIQLKNYTKIHNNIIEAFAHIEPNCQEPLRTYVQQFLTELNGGIDFSTAISHFKDRVNIYRFKLFLANIEYCYVYGGDFTELLDKTQKFISNIQAEKKRRIQETRFAILMLFILIGLDIFIYFDFIKTQPEYLSIMKTTISGQLILNANFLSLWFLLGLAYYVRKLDY